MRGTYYRWSKAPLVEQHINLTTKPLREPCNKLLDGEALSASGTLTWKRGDWLQYRLERRGAVILLHVAYKLNDGEELDYPIPITYTSPHFGGRRFWFTCPLSVNGRACGRRVGKLYFRGRFYGCRHCHGLTYASTRESPLDCHGDAQRAIIRRLGGEPGGLFPSLPQKPKWMHWTTYERLARRFRAVQDAELVELDRSFNIFHGRLAALGVDVEPPDFEGAREAPLSSEERYQRIIDAWREGREEERRAFEEEREARRYPTLGTIASRAGVPFAFALEAQRRGLVTADKGRGTRRRRYRAKLYAWLEKLHVLNRAGYSWEALEAWSGRRWREGHEDERRFPRGFQEREGGEASPGTVENS